jgi:GNAT superfamily N-acetyltransferase
MAIRRAQVDEHEVLSRIALEAKAHWGYCAEDLARWKADLTVSAISLAHQPTFVAERGRCIAGFFQLSFASDDPELEHFWVLPEFMGRGVGRALLGRAVQDAAERGHIKLVIDADPNAERFYTACGAVRTGEKPAPVVGQPNRVRPQLVLSANATQPGNAPDA